MSYATPTEFLQRYDSARVGELVRDDGTRATVAQLLSDAVLQAQLDDAMAAIHAAVRVGEHYTTAELAALTDTNRLLLVRLNCDLAYGLLLQRRGYPADQISNLAPGYISAMQLLDQLREGERLFNLDAQANAGSAVDVDHWPNNNRGIYRLSREAERYFGDLCLPKTPDCC